MPEEVTINRRYRGPITSGNGGYSCGLMANALRKELSGPLPDVSGTAVIAKLTAPPPLDTPLTLDVVDDRATLRHNGENIGHAARSTLTLEIPACPSPETAIDAATRYVGLDNHALSECFVCGPDRTPPDGLCLFTGPVNETTTAPVATLWIPHTEFASEDGHIRTEILWAALDCPSYFGLRVDGLIALLGTMTAQIHAAPLAQEPCIVMGWKISNEGRKYTGGSALFRTDGTLLGCAECLWIERRRG